MTGVEVETDTTGPNESSTPRTLAGPHGVDWQREFSSVRKVRIGREDAVRQRHRETATRHELIVELNRTVKRMLKQVGLAEWGSRWYGLPCFRVTAPTTNSRWLSEPTCREPHPIRWEVRHAVNRKRSPRGYITTLYESYLVRLHFTDEGIPKLFSVEGTVTTWSNDAAPTSLGIALREAMSSGLNPNGITATRGVDNAISSHPTSREGGVNPGSA